MAQKITSERLEKLFQARQGIRQGYYILSQLRDGALYDELAGCSHLLFSSLELLDKTLDDESLKEISDDIITACANCQQGINGAVRVLRAQ